MTRKNQQKNNTKRNKQAKSNIDLFLNEAEQTEEVNEMLIDAIKAKLAILDSMDDWLTDSSIVTIYY